MLGAPRRIGVLALQGAFAKHIQVCKSLGYDAFAFRELEDLGSLGALIIPGGESTTIGMLLERRGLVAPIKAAIEAGLPVFGTCAGAILLAKDICNSEQTRLGTMNIRIERNAYGSQVDSFETRLDVRTPDDGLSFETDAVFIRAPRIEHCSPELSILAKFNGFTVLVQEKNMLACTFHPELTQNTKVHEYFIQRLAKL